MDRGELSSKLLVVGSAAALGFASLLSAGLGFSAGIYDERMRNAQTEIVRAEEERLRDRSIAGAVALGGVVVVGGLMLLGTRYPR